MPPVPASVAGLKSRAVRGVMFVQLGSPAGNILAIGAFSLAALLPKEDLLAWCWRIPFLFSAVLVIFGLFIRLQLEESREFLDNKTTEQVVSSPRRAFYATSGVQLSPPSSPALSESASPTLLDHSWSPQRRTGTCSTT